VVIAGIGSTAFGTLPGRSTVSLNIEACRRALADAGIDKDLVDAVFVKYPTSRFEHLYAHRIAAHLGLQPKIASVIDQAGASNVGMVAAAALAIEAGQCDVALVSFADNPRSGTRHAYEQPGGADAVFGWFGVPAAYAMIARAHMQQYGTTSRQLGAIAAVCRANGARNPAAQLRKPITVEDHQESPYIVEPLRRDDCCLVSDGGAAVVVMSAKRARELGVPHSAAILGFGQGHTAWSVEQRPDLTSTAAVVSARTAFEMAGLGPSDIDVAQIYDCFTIAVLMTLEDYGFCRKGSGGRYVAEGNIGLDGPLPINTSGGLLSETGMPGMQLILEAVRQLRGASPNQVAAADKVIVSNQGGTMQSHATLILGSS
jgi:acetyl-CoA acetyltransferase